MHWSGYQECRDRGSKEEFTQHDSLTPRIWRSVAPGSAHASAPANKLFWMMAWTPQLPSTTWVTPKSTASYISEIASSSVRPLVAIRKDRILRNASLMARSTDDFS